MKGLTLIEVLIALAIASIALTAIIKTTSESIRSTTYLENKTIATWVAREVLTTKRLRLSETSPMTMLGKKWYWEFEQTETPNPRIRRHVVHVFQKATEHDSVTPLVTMEGFVYASE